MKKIILIGMAAIGASVAVLGGCSGSENTAKVESTTEVAEETTTESVSQSTTDDINYSIELDESKRPKFEEETELYSLNANGKVVNFQLPKTWETERSETYGTKEMNQYSSKSAERDVWMFVNFFDEIYNEDEIISKGYSVAHTTVDGLDAIYVNGDGDDDYDEYTYAIPFNDGFICIDFGFSNAYENKEKLKYLDMVASSIDVNVTETAGATAGDGAATNYDDWHTQIVTSKDYNGYVYETELKISNFIAAENEDRVLAAWKEVSNGYEFSEPISRTKTTVLNHIYNNPETYKFYAVGTITHKNITEGFENDERSGTYWFYYDRDLDIGENSDSSDIFGKLYFEDGVKNFVCTDGLRWTVEIKSENDDFKTYFDANQDSKVSAEYKKFRNSIGPTPFILVVGIYTGMITPKHPEPDPIPDSLMLNFEVPASIDNSTQKNKVELKIEQAN